MKANNIHHFPYLLFFKSKESYFIVETRAELITDFVLRLKWLFGEAESLNLPVIEGNFIGPRKEMITPWSTNAVEITQNMGISGISRIEEFFETGTFNGVFDPMLQTKYANLTQEIFRIDKEPDEVIFIENIPEYNTREGLALSEEEVEYLRQVSKKIGRNLTDSEIFGFSQVNSEHCRHKIFNGTFIINGEEKKESLFELIKKTSRKNQNFIISAYKDNVAFIDGPMAEQFAPETQHQPDFFIAKDIKTVISVKAETHNFPTTVEPFNGAATGSGGEIRDRMAGGKGSIPIAGTAVYMTSFSRLEDNRGWEKNSNPRSWLYHNPAELLIKASNGASDFGNKFGQPLICGSLLTFEHVSPKKYYGYDKMVMLAGGVGFAKETDSRKEIPAEGDKIILLGGDNYRIGMGGGAVSSVSTGEFHKQIELNAVQRSNPEMQKRIYNAIRAMAESDENPVISVHDHGAGGHLNCYSEIVEHSGGKIDLNELPIGDPTLSAKEIIGNESQERMGLVMREKDLEKLKKVAERERAPIYTVGEITNDKKFTFVDKQKNIKPLDLKLEYLFGMPPKTVIMDVTDDDTFVNIDYQPDKFEEYLDQVLLMEAVACKDWLTNKVDRSVTGRIAKQQTAGSIQLPLNNLGVVTLDYHGLKGIATSIGHAPVTGMINPEAGSRMAVAEALTNIVWAPLKEGLRGVSLSANWMWPAKNKGEDSRLYRAVESISKFAIDLGINIPTGKDSLSMTQKYPDGQVVFSPGTVIVSAVAEVIDINKVIEPVLINDHESFIFYIDISGMALSLGGSCFSVLLNKLGTDTPDVNPVCFRKVFDLIQKLINSGDIIAGHDISTGGLITTLLEMTFVTPGIGMDINLNTFVNNDFIQILFSENPGLIIQVNDAKKITGLFKEKGISGWLLGKPSNERFLKISYQDMDFRLDIDRLRDTWYKTSWLLDKKQTANNLADTRYKNYKKQVLEFIFRPEFKGTFSSYGIDPRRKNKTGIKAAIIREKGVNGDREMAYAMHLAGFDVKDVHMTDLITGRETLEELNFIVFVGGFSNSDVLGSAKGWAGAFLYNEKARLALENFYGRKDTLSLGICNGCQVMVELGLIYPDHQQKPKMLVNDSHKFESGFINVEVLPNDSVLLKTLAGSRLGIWVAHGEGKFRLPYEESKYHIPVKYSYAEYPGNPNGSDYAVAAICSIDGRHLAMMPHLERAYFPWQWAHYLRDRKTDQVTPWIEAFVNAREWVKKF